VLNFFEKWQNLVDLVIDAMFMAIMWINNRFVRSGFREIIEKAKGDIAII
jgi:hypothetical protein